MVGLLILLSGMLLSVVGVVVHFLRLQKDAESALIDTQAALKCVEESLQWAELAIARKNERITLLKAELERVYNHPVGQMLKKEQSCTE